MFLFSWNACNYYFLILLTANSVSYACINAKKFVEIIWQPLFSFNLDDDYAFKDNGSSIRVSRMNYY